MERERRKKRCFLERVSVGQTGKRERGEIQERTKDEDGWRWMGYNKTTLTD
jgi:hypothetical protein